MKDLSMVAFEIFEIKPQVFKHLNIILMRQQVLLYSKEIQTEDDTVAVAEDEPQHEIIHVDVHVSDEVNELSKIEESQEEEHSEGSQQLAHLSEQDRDDIMRSNEFLEFFEVSSKLMERALHGDDLIDYRAENINFEDSERDQFQFKNEFYHEKWTKSRIVTSLDWSAKVILSFDIILVNQSYSVLGTLFSIL